MACIRYRLDAAIEHCDPVVDGAISAILINADDITSYTRVTTPTEFNVFKAIVLASTKKGYSVSDAKILKPFDGSGSTHVDGGVRPLTSKTLEFIIGDNTDKGAREVAKLEGNGYVAVKRLRNGKYEIIGKESPLYLTDKTLTKDGWAVTMSCEEVTPGNFLWDTNETTTLATYTALT